MAAVNSHYRHSSSSVPDLDMRRTAPPGRSRIPVSQPGQAKRDSVRYQSAPSGQLSRLEIMQHDFQNKLLMEKEEKMIGIYEQNQEQALRKVSGKSERRESNGGIVRDFFRERRAIEQNKSQNVQLSRDVHFKKKKQQRDREMEIEDAKTQQMVDYQRKLALQQQAQYHKQQQQQLPQYHQQQQHQLPQNYHQPRQQPHAVQTPPHQQQPSRIKPLAPIRRQASKKPPSPDGVFETTDSFSVDMNDQSSEQSSRGVHRKGPSAKQTLKPIGSKAKMERQHRDPREQSGPQRKRAAINPAQRNIPAATQRHAPSQQPHHKKEKLTDFQKFQMERDQERLDRLDRHSEKQKPRMFADESDSSLEYDHEKQEQIIATKRKQHEYQERKRKEAELEALIAQHQKDLARLQTSEEELNRSEDWSAQPEQQPQPSQPMRTIKVRRQSRIESVTPHHEETVTSEKPSRGGHQLRSSTVTAEQPADIVNNNKPMKAPLQRKQSQKRKPQPPANPPPQMRTSSPPLPLKAEASFYEQAVMDLEPNPELDLRGCPNCGRRFAADRIAKHVSACKKVAKAAKKRKVFDMTKQRNEGSEALQFVKRGEHLKDKAPVSAHIIC